MATKIIQKENPILRDIAKNVLVSEIESARIKKIITDMKKALHAENDGVAIAAPQIGVSLRIFVVAGKIFDEAFVRGEVKKDFKTDKEDLIFINPVFKKISKTKKWMQEGCLSVRWLYGEVARSTQATVEAYNEKGEKFVRGGGGLLAHIFQHEIDHLDGVLFIDKARDIKDQPPEKE